MGHLSGHSWGQSLTATNGSNTLRSEMEHPYCYSWGQSLTATNGSNRLRSEMGHQ